MTSPRIAASLLIVAVLLFGGVWVWSTRDQREETPVSPVASTDASLLPSPSLEGGEGGPAHDPLSLAAFAEREFQGSDLALGRVLDEGADFIRYAITYKSGTLTISGVLQVPKRGAGPFPVIITNHGHIDTSVYTIGRGLRREHDALTRGGYVILHPDYRNHAGSDKEPNTDRDFRLGYAEDVINAVKAVRASDLPFLDKERIGMFGHSMGGGVTLQVLVTQPELIKAAVLYAPVSADARDNYERWTTRRPELAREIAERYGTPEERPAFWDAISPITFIDNIRVPVMIHHGTRDDSVPLPWSERLAAALREHRKNVTLHIYDGEVHEFVTQHRLFMERTVAFFDAHVKGTGE